MQLSDYRKINAKNFIRQFATVEYRDMLPAWERIADVLAGEDVVKSKGEKYIYRTKRKKQDADLWNAFCWFAHLPDYAEKTFSQTIGVLARAKATAILPSELRFMLEWATPKGVGLDAVRVAFDCNIVTQGSGCAFIDPVTPNDDNVGTFSIKEYHGDDYINAEIDESGSESFARWVLLNESGLVFDEIKKSRSAVAKMRLLALDRNNVYYQVALTPEQWPSWDISNPVLAADIENPQPGEAVYVTYFGQTLSRLPFVRYGVRDLSLSPMKYPKPPILNLVDLMLHILNCDAVYQQTLRLTGEPQPYIVGGDGADPLTIGKGGNSLWHLSDGWHPGYLEFSGSGAAAQRQNLIDLQEEAKSLGLSLSGTELGQTSGVALDIIRNAQTSALVQINETSCDAIRRLLRYAGQWMNWKREKSVREIDFIPSNDFAKATLTSQELMNVYNAMLTSVRDGKPMPVTLQEFRKMAESCLDLGERDFDELMKEVETDFSDNHIDETPSNRNIPGLSGSDEQ